MVEIMTFSERSQILSGPTIPQGIFTRFEVLGSRHDLQAIYLIRLLWAWVVL